MKPEPVALLPLTTLPFPCRALLLALASPALLVTSALAQSAPAAATRLPVVNVSAQKYPQSVQAAPVSVTPVTRGALEDSGARAVSDVAGYSPNTHLTEFSARKLSNPRFRGIGSSPSNPAVTTFIDGVPQLNANSSSLELIDVEQIDFIRGPQGALFGRNTLGGLIAISSIRPSLDQLTGSLTGGFGDYGLREGRLALSGPLAGKDFGYAVAAGYSEREGYVKNSVTGNDVDHREATFGKAQLLWRPRPEWEARLIVSAEKARDGDYRLHDLAAIRANPRSVTRDFEGFTQRDVLAPTFVLARTGGGVDLTFTTGAVWWDALDATDLDYSIAPLIRRENAEEGFQFTQEVRIASARNAQSSLQWQAGAFFFRQDYDQDAFNFFSNPVFLGYPAGTPAFRSYTQAALDDTGYGAFGQVTLKLRDDFDLAVGVRGDFEQKDAALRTFTSPAGFGAATQQSLDDDFSEFSPHAIATYRLAPDQSWYASVARGYKAGGFNAASPSSTERFDQESSWSYETGLKTSALDQRVRASLALFYTRWDDLQLNVPNPFAPGQFYISNVGAAASKGVELEFNARPAAGWDIFGGAGWISAKFRTGTRASGLSVDDKRLPFTPDYTLNGGTQYSFPLGKGSTGYVRGEVVAYGRYFYSEDNSVSQSAYSLAHVRAGVRARHWTLEAWVRNALDEDYVPLAIPYPGLAPSGYLGESGAPVTTGVSATLRF